MTDRRLNNLIVMNTSKDILDNINMNAMIQNWATLKERRINVLLLEVIWLNLNNLIYRQALIDLDSYTTYFLDQKKVTTALYLYICMKYNYTKNEERYRGPPMTSPRTTGWKTLFNCHKKIMKNFINRQPRILFDIVGTLECPKYYSNQLPLEDAQTFKFSISFNGIPIEANPTLTGHPNIASYGIQTTKKKTKLKLDYSINSWLSLSKKKQLFHKINCHKRITPIISADYLLNARKCST
ncbi:hypothetical protein AGLY_009081, partial [Aphis glycines]